MTPLSPTARQTSQPPALQTGAPLDQADGLGILLHGRGASASDIIGLAGPLTPRGELGERIAWLAPQAAGNVWYPHRFTEPIALNQEALAAALGVIDAIIERAIAAGLPADRVMLTGFSQGGCLALEYAWQGQYRVGAVGALSGGLVGQLDTDPRPAADLSGLPIFVGMGDADAIVPLSQIEASVALLEQAGADVTYQLYPGLGHGIIRPETDILRQMMTDLTRDAG
ncbi:MAG: dienelactone hydrolase family protein [Chloroflexota bacterium]|nr:dienelactone hydrolase family protein [Chloroflexota bacterium]